MINKHNPVAHIAQQLLHGGHCYFMPNGGNLGDCLIACATIQSFNRAGLPWSFIRGNRQSVRSQDLLVFGGGGSLVPLYEGGIQCVESLKKLGAPVVILPQTVRGNIDFWMRSKDVTVFCRDSTSLEFLSGFPNIPAFLADDMALALDLKADPFSTVSAVREVMFEAKEKRVLLALRRDQEAIGRANSQSIDISALAYPAMDSVESIYANTCTFLTVLAGYSEIETDRLHVAIGASLLGIPVRLYNNANGKNRAVYETSLKKRFPNLLFVSESAASS
jgi:exopolysaccharide biosynthesis predicted pyruvyltransferase EpsI